MLSCRTREHLSPSYRHSLFLTSTSHHFYLAALESRLNPSMTVIGATNFRRNHLWITLTCLPMLFLVVVIVQHSFTPKVFVYQPYREPRICCLIFTAPKYFTSRTLAVNSTWAPRCDRYYFISEPSNDSVTPMQYRVSFQFPLAPIGNITQGYGHLTQKATAAFRFVYERHRDDFDWFVKADDDTYLIVENLRAFLREQNSSEPVTFGYNFKVSEYMREKETG